MKKGVADVYLYDEIGFWGVPASAFVAELNRLDVDQINLYLNSPGGEVGDGVAIFNALKRNRASVVATGDGSVLSIASVIMQAGDKRRMAQGSAMMIHDPWIGAMGDAEFMRKMADQLDKDADEIASIYADRAGGEASEWRDRMKDETWYRPQEAVTAGLADETVSFSAGSKNRALNRAFNLDRFKNVPEWAPKAEKRPDPVPDPAEKPVIVIPDPVSVVRGMNITPAQKRAAIAHLKAHTGAAA